MTGKSYPKRGEIYWVDLDPSKGAETRKLRPALILSNDIGNENSNLVIVAPLTSKASKVYPFEVALNLENKSAKIMLNQSRAIDKCRLGKKITTLDKLLIPKIDRALKLVLGLS